MMIRNLRWSFNCTNWKPNENELLLALNCIQKEEIERINQFAFKRDYKHALIGRLLLRKCFHEIFNLNNEQINFTRNDKGKPIIEKLNLDEKNAYDFNISHNGDYCVLAFGPYQQIGIDVMKIEYKGGRQLDEFFRLMNKQFSNSEWNFIKSINTECEQLRKFIRLWCLKESYVKAKGIGISYDLKRISFRCIQPDLNEQEIINSTKIFVDGSELLNWTFEETLLNRDHCVAVAFENNCSPTQTQEQTKFVDLNFLDLISNFNQINNVDNSFWQKFSNKL